MNFIDKDKKVINDAYRDILFHLKEYLQQYNLENELEYSKIIFNMLHRGFFSMNGVIRFDNNFNYLGLPLEVSQGIQVMYGVCCCRHAAEFLYDVLRIFNFHPSLMYILIDPITGDWRKVNPAIERSNHQAVLIHNDLQYIADPANQFLLEVQEDGKIQALDTECFVSPKFYQDDRVEVVGKVLKKYYTYRELGVERIY